MEKEQGNKSWLKRILLVLLLIVVVLGVLCGGISRVNKRALEKFYKCSSQAFHIPDINKFFIPQGIAYNPDTDEILVTGYMTNGKASPIYVIDRESGSLKKSLYMLYSDGKKFKGHAGGIAVYNGKVYIAGSTKYCMYVIDSETIKSASDGANVYFSDVVDLKNQKDYMRVSFTGYDGEYLYAGEFHKDPLFYTYEGHNVETANGIQKGLVVGFSLEGNIATAQKAYSIADNVQGVEFDEQYVYLSVSHGYNNSKLMVYRRYEESSKELLVLGKSVPLFNLDDESLVAEYDLPPMSEEICIIDGKMYIMCEAASNRYIMGKFYDADYIYAVDLKSLMSD